MITLTMKQMERIVDQSDGDVGAAIRFAYDKGYKQSKKESLVNIKRLRNELEKVKEEQNAKVSQLYP